MTVLDRISEDTLIFLQLHKRVWPTAQRDALFWSHIRKIPPSDPANGDAHDTWIVCNQSTDHPDAPVSGGGRARAGLDKKRKSLGRDGKIGMRWA